MDAWAKLDRDGRRHSLVAHSLDVACTLAAILKTSGTLSRLEAAAGREVSTTDIDRLAVAAGLHDIGKVHPLFQAKSDGRRTGLNHSQAGFGLLGMRVGALGPHLDAIRHWFTRDLAQVVFAHHGRPVLPGGYADPSGWLAAARSGESPFIQARTVMDTLLSTFPRARDPGPPLPTGPRFHHHVAGLVTLADWIASDADLFPFTDPVPPDYAERAARQADAALKRLSLGDEERGRARCRFEDVAPFAPRPAQLVVGELSQETKILVIEAETGSGKTEAALWHFARLHAAGQVEGLYFALPTRAAASQLHVRVQRALDRMFPVPPEAVLAIPGQRVAGMASGTALPDFRTLWDDLPNGARDTSRWAAEQATRFLAAAVAVGTIDQAMLAALQVRHAPMRGTALSRSLLVIDEVHASDQAMISLVDSLLRDHLVVGGRALLMSATLGSAARARLLEAPIPPLEAARSVPYPTVWAGRDRVAVPAQGSTKAVTTETRPTMAGGALAAEVIAASRRGARVLVVRNTVRAAVEAYEAVCAAGGADLLLQLGGGPALHHARFAAEDRMRLDAAVEGALGRREAGGGTIVIGSQTLEQSLDLCADLLVTDLCPIDVLLQRIGRLHRHDNPRPPGFEEARCVVLLPECGLDALAAPAFHNGLGAFGKDLGGIYKDLAILALTEARLHSDPVWTIPEMNRDLVESCTHPEPRADVARTRGWEDYHARLTGQGMAEVMMMHRWRLDRGRPFPEAFACDDEMVMTRLGEMGPTLRLPVGTIGPFGSSISQIALPARWARGIEMPEVATVQTAGEEELSLTAGGARFRYSRTGLAPEKT